MFKKKEVGQLVTDLVVNNFVIIKITNLETEIDRKTEIAAKNQLLFTDKEVLLILNFGIEGQHKRLFLTNDFKK